MGDEQGRDSRTGEALAQNGGDLGGGLDVEGGGGLIEDQDVGTENERAGLADSPCAITDMTAVPAVSHTRPR